MFEIFSTSEAWISLLTLTILEIVLGIDNLVFIAILADKLPLEERERARKIGLSLALITRILLLLSITSLIKLTAPLFSIGQFDFSGKDLILILGGLFLLWKSTTEIHNKLESKEGHGSVGMKATVANIIIQIMLLDIVFSLDSVITAVGMADEVLIMILAVLIAIIIMVVSIDKISGFVENHPSVKILALSFLLMIGFTLVADGFGQHIEKGYVYFSMGFSIFVEMLNLNYRTKNIAPVNLRKKY
jgi:predicted tellurium resistance membrane protein TerC